MLRRRKLLEIAARPTDSLQRQARKMLKYKVEYEPLSMEAYEAHYRERQIKYLQKKAAKLGFHVVPT